MGADIHSHVEVFRDGAWRKATTPMPQRTNVTTAADNPMISVLFRFGGCGCCP